MQSDIHQSDQKGAKAANESSPSANSSPAPNRLARRSFLRNIGIGAALLAPGAALLSCSAKALAKNGNEKEKNALTRGDVAILQLLAAAELIETDLWKQYNELGGVNAPDSGYKAGLVILDGDQPQYIADNTDDEISHAAFLNAYLKSKGEQEVDLSHFATLAPSQVSFVPQTGRLTNLKQLTVDTSWWTRYRGIRNPDFGDAASSRRRAQFGQMAAPERRGRVRCGPGGISSSVQIFQWIPWDQRPGLVAYNRWKYLLHVAQKEPGG